MFITSVKGSDLVATASCRIEFDSNNTADPDGLIDTAGVVDVHHATGTSGLYHVSTGIIDVFLDGPYKRVAVVGVQMRSDTADMQVRAYSADVVTATGAYDTAKVRLIVTTTSSGTVLDTNNVHFILDLELSP